MTVRRGVEGGAFASTLQKRQKMIGGQAGPKGAHVMASARRDYLPESERRSYPTRPAFLPWVALGSSAVIPRRSSRLL